MHNSPFTPRGLSNALTHTVLKGLGALSTVAVEQGSRRNAWAGMSENATRTRALREAEDAMAVAIARAGATGATRARR